MTKAAGSIPGTGKMKECYIGYMLVKYFVLHLKMRKQKLGEIKLFDESQSLSGKTRSLTF